MLITLFARREPTGCPETRAAFPKARRNDVAIYRDEACTDRRAVFRWWLRAKPRRGQRSVILNCFRWRLQWLLDAPGTFR